MVEGAGNYSFPFLVLIVADHGECLASACLSVCEDGTIEPIERLFDEGKAAGLVDLVLLGLDAKDVVKDEILDLVLALFDTEHIVLCLYAERRVHIGLSLVPWAHSQGDLD